MQDMIFIIVDVTLITKDVKEIYLEVKDGMLGQIVFNRQLKEGELARIVYNREMPSRTLDQNIVFETMDDIVMITVFRVKTVMAMGGRGRCFGGGGGGR